MKTEKDVREEDIILGKRFTTYVELAVKRRKREYYQLQYKTMEICSLMENCNVASTFDIEQETFAVIPGWLTLENEVLQKELQKLSDRNLCVFWNHAVEKESLAQIARELGLSYDTVTSIYYRTLKKIKEGLIQNGYKF